MKIVIASLLTMYATLALAEVNCPPTYLATEVTFSHTIGAENIWDLFSNPFIYADKKWQIVFTVYLPDANTETQALEEGDYYYHTRVDFFRHPMGRTRENAEVCYYAQKDETYFVYAISYTK